MEIMERFEELLETKPERRFFLDRWEEVGCPICKQKAPTREVWHDPVRGNIVRCRQCGLVYRTPRLNEDYLTRHFETEWTESQPAFQLDEYRADNLKRIVKWVLKKHPSPGTVLDIGSSYGALLAQFPKTWQLFGVEPSLTACQHARERLPGATIINATLDNAVLPEKSFDVIIMVDTIYYLANPLRDLSRLPSLLRPGGFILIEAPNYNNRALVYRLIRHHFDETWMYFYTPKHLEEMVRLAGMKVVNRFHLPGHQIGERNILPKALAMAEYVTLLSLYKITFKSIDFMPHFVLALQPIINLDYLNLSKKIIDNFNHKFASKFIRNKVKIELTINNTDRIEDVVNMHIEYLQTFFKLNKSMYNNLTYYYEIADKDEDNILIIARANGLIIGYICIIKSLRSQNIKIFKKYHVMALIDSFLVIPFSDKLIIKSLIKRLLIILKGEYHMFNILTLEKKDYRKICELRPIIVAKNYRGTGLADILVSSAEDILKWRGEKEYFLRVHKDNTRAINFYYKNGFILEGYEDNDLILGKSLT